MAWTFSIEIYRKENGVIILFRGVLGQMAKSLWSAPLIENNKYFFPADFILFKDVC